MKIIDGKDLKYQKLFETGGFDENTDGRVCRTEDGRYIAIEAVLYNIGSAGSVKTTYYELDLEDLKSCAGTAYVRRKLTKEQYNKIIAMESIGDEFVL